MKQSLVKQSEKSAIRAMISASVQILVKFKSAYMHNLPTSLKVLTKALVFTLSRVLVIKA